MPQNGLHGLVGLATARVLVHWVPLDASVPFVAGIVLGAMLPDVDMYPTAVAFLAQRSDLIYSIHRSLTHSLPLILLLLGAGALSKVRVWRYGLWGLAIGISTHVVLDTLFWFTQIDLFWPFSHLPAENPALPVVNLWAGQHMPALFVNVRESVEYAAFALLLGAIQRIAPTDNLLTTWKCFAWIYFVVTLATAVVFKENSKIQNVIVTGPYLLLFLPVCWLAVWRNREAIAKWALRRGDAHGREAA